MSNTEEFIRFYSDRSTLSRWQTRRLMRRLKRKIRTGAMPSWRDWALLARTRDPLRQRSTVKRWLSQHPPKKEET